MSFSMLRAVKKSSPSGLGSRRILHSVNNAPVLYPDLDNTLVVFWGRRTLGSLSGNNNNDHEGGNKRGVRVIPAKTNPNQNGLNHSHPRPPNQWMSLSNHQLEQVTRTLLQPNNPSQLPLHVPSPTKPADYVNILKAWMYRSNPQQDGIQAAQKAEALLKTFQDQQLLPLPLVIPAYEVVLRAYSNSKGGTQAAERAQAILKFLLHQTEYTPTPFCYQCLLQTIAQSGNPEPIQYWKTLLPHQYQQTLLEAEFQAWSNSPTPQAPQQILQLLLLTMEQWKQSKDNHPPNTILVPTLRMFHLAMGALAKSATHHQHISARQAAQQMEQILRLLQDKQSIWNIPPNLRTYLMVLGAWERVEKIEKGSGDASQRADTIIKELIQSSPRLPTTTTGTLVTPNSHCFAAVVISYLHAQQIERAESILFQWMDFFHTTNDPKAMPTTLAATQVLLGWAKALQPDRILHILHRMQQLANQYPHHPELRLNLRIYNTFLYGLANTGQTDSVLAGLAWLEQTHDTKSGDSTNPGSPWSMALLPPTEPPDHYTYLQAIVALGKQQPPRMREAETVLQRMKQRGLIPNRFVYSAMIHSYALSEEPEKVRKCHALLQEIVSDLDVACAVAFWQVCARANSSSSSIEEQRLALDLAFQVYHQFQERTSAAVYSAIVRVVQALVADRDERVRLLRRIARDGCDGGYLTEAWNVELERSVYPETVASLLGQRQLQANWSRNVKFQERPKACKGVRQPAHNKRD